MRWFTIVATGLLLLAPGRFAEGQVKVAVTLGPSLVTLTDDETPWSLNGEAPWSWHGGGAVGVTAGFPVSDRWGFELGGAYSIKGEYEEYDTEGCDRFCVVSSSRTIPFLESTILADRWVEHGNVGMHLLGGAFLGYAHGDHPVIGMIERFDFGVAGGARLEVGLHGKLGLSLGMLYTHGLRNIGDNVGFGATRTLNVNIGLFYSIE